MKQYKLFYLDDEIGEFDDMELIYEYINKKLENYPNLTRDNFSIWGYLC